MKKGKRRKAPEPDSPKGEGHEHSQGHRSVRTDHGASSSGSSLTAGRGAAEEWERSIFSYYPPKAGSLGWKSKQPGQTIVAPLVHREEDIHGRLGLLMDQLRAPRLAQADVDEDGMVHYRAEVDESCATVIKVYRVEYGAPLLILIGECPAKGHVRDSPYEQCGLKIAKVLIENGIVVSVATMDVAHSCYVAAKDDQSRSGIKASMMSVRQMVKAIGGADQKQQSQARLIETTKAIATAAAIRFQEELRPSNIIAMPIGAILRPSDGFFSCAPEHLIAEMKEYGRVRKDDTEYATLLPTLPYPGKYSMDAVRLIVNAGVAVVAPSLVAEAALAADELTAALITQRQARAASLGGTARCDGGESHLEMSSVGGSANTDAQFEARSALGKAKCDGGESHLEMSSLGGSANTDAQFNQRSAFASAWNDGGVAHMKAVAAGGAATPRGAAHPRARQIEQLDAKTLEVLRRFDTTVAAHVHVIGTNRGNIGRALKNGTAQYGFKWRHAPVDDDDDDDDNIDSSRAAGPPPSAKPWCDRCEGWGHCGLCYEAAHPNDDDDDIIDLSED